MSGQVALKLPSGGTLTLTGTDTASAVTVTFPASSGTVFFAGGALGTPSSGTLTNCTGLPVSTGVSGLGTGVATALAVNVGSAGAPVVNGGVLGTPSSGTLSSCTGLPVSTGVSGLGTGVATFLATPSSANLAAALTDETGSGAAVFATSPTLVTPILGTPTSGTLTNCTGLPVSTGVSGLGTGVATALAVAVGSAGAPVVNGGALGTPSSGTLSSCTVDGTNSVGYLTIPQNAQTGNYTLVAADSGKHIYHASGAGAATYTIPANSSVAYAIGTAVTFVNLSSTSISIAITTDTMYLSGMGTTGTRTLAQYGTATALKITSTAWIISGSGLT